MPGSCLCLFPQMHPSFPPPSCSSSFRPCSADLLSSGDLPRGNLWRCAELPAPGASGLQPVPSGPYQPRAVLNLAMFPGCCCPFNHTVYIYLNLDSKKPVSRYKLSAYFSTFFFSLVLRQKQSLLSFHPPVSSVRFLDSHPGAEGSPHTHRTSGTEFCSAILSATNTDPQVHSLLSSLTILCAVPHEMLLPVRFLITVDFLIRFLSSWFT